MSFAPEVDVRYHPEAACFAHATVQDLEVVFQWVNQPTATNVLHQASPTMGMAAEFSALIFMTGEPHLSPAFFKKVPVLVPVSA